MINYSQFHQNLLGINPALTPIEFRISSLQRRLYDEAANGKHGGLVSHRTALENWDQFLGSFVIAYAQTSEGAVFIAVSAPVHKWVNAQVKTVARHIFSARKNTPKRLLVELYQSFQSLSIGSNVHQIPEPPRWIAYGFHDKDLLPPWMRGKLSILNSKADLTCDEKRPD